MSRKTAVLWERSALLRALLVTALLLVPFTYGPAAWAETPVAESSEPVPGAELWRDIRQGTSGFTNSPGSEDGNLINVSGETWRQTRNGVISDFGQWIMAGVVLALGLIFVTRGPIKMEHERSGKTIERWTSADRIIHWYVAVLFIVLALTGLSFLYGKAVLMPLIGKSAFAAWGSLAKVLHNYGGPLFAVGLILMIVKWMRYNGFNAVDAAWLAKGGGILTRAHPSAGYLNAGEKLWYWLVTFAGLGVVITGLILDFPNFEQTRQTMQQANILHGIFALALVAVFIGHVYIATIGTEGALEGMVSGHVDVEWAKQHHDLWYQEVVEGRAEAPVPDSSTDTEIPAKPAPT